MFCHTSDIIVGPYEINKLLNTLDFLNNMKRPDTPLGLVDYTLTFIPILRKSSISFKKALYCFLDIRSLMGRDSPVTSDFHYTKLRVDTIFPFQGCGVWIYNQNFSFCQRQDWLWPSDLARGRVSNLLVLHPCIFLTRRVYGFSF